MNWRETYHGFCMRISSGRTTNTILWRLPGNHLCPIIVHNIHLKFLLERRVSQKSSDNIKKYLISMHGELWARLLEWLKVDTEFHLEEWLSTRERLDVRCEFGRYRRRSHCWCMRRDDSLGSWYRRVSLIRLSISFALKYTLIVC